MEFLTPPVSASYVVPVTAGDNGTQTYVVKAYDLANHVVESAPIAVTVDIAWDWVRSIDGVHTNEIFLATDAMGAVYVAGTTELYDAFLIKQDADGNRVWLRNFGGPNHEYAKSVGVDPSGRVFITGDAFQPPPSLRGDCFLSLYDADGTLIRTQVVDIPGWEKLGCVATTDASGNFYVAGGVADSAVRSTDVFLIKYDRDGNTLWTRTVGSTPGTWNDDVFTSIAIDPTGGVYIGGYTNGTFDAAPNRSASRDLFVLKYDADGNELWSGQYGTQGLTTFGDHLAIDQLGNVYFAGENVDATTYTSFYTTNNVLLISYAANGTFRWVRTLDGGGSDRGWGVVADTRGVYLTGVTEGGISGHHEITEPTQGASDILFAKFSTSGDLVSVRLFGSPAYDSGDAVAIGANGALYIGGTVSDAATGLNTPILLRLRDAP
jgi:hypothetical protein